MKMNKRTVYYLGVTGILTLLFAGGCQNEKDPEPVADCSASGLEITVDNVESASGCDTSDGSITVSAEGGVGTVMFRFATTNLQASGTFINLPAGNYIVVAQDESGCEVSENVTVDITGSNLAIASVTPTDAGCQNTNGELSISATGQGTLMYKAGNSSFQESNTFVGLGAGTYAVTVKDDSGCEVTAEGKVLHGTSYDLQVKDIIMTNCAITGCHNGDNGASRNWTVFSNVQNKASIIKEKTQNGSMPIGGSLTEEEKALIACWVDDGALDN